MKIDLYKRCPHKEYIHINDEQQLLDRGDTSATFWVYKARHYV